MSEKVPRNRPADRLASPEELTETLARIAPKVEFCSLRWVERRREGLSIRRGTLEPLSLNHSQGVMVTVIDQGGIGYSATSDLTFAGLYQAAREAHHWAIQSQGRSVANFSTLQRPQASGSYRTSVRDSWQSRSTREKIDRLREADEILAADSRIRDRRATLEYSRTETRFVTTDNIEVSQQIETIAPGMLAVASDGGETQQRSLGGRGACRQSGLEALDELEFDSVPAQLRDEAIALLSAPLCPDGVQNLVLGPAQMILQIHESIGHPLELDRILGDERNFAGTTFVRREDFGSLRYGSDLLNVTFDPTVSNEFASYAFDDEGSPAERTHLIEGGILKRGIGGAVSQQRLDVAGVSCSRACSWNRPPIDRMANINLEPGEDSYETLLQKAGNGVLMDVNSSWSIDDSRRNFQFGCEVGWLIEDGERTTMVRNPGYRGRSSDFWRSLAAVGDRSTVTVLGTPNCGKGEPNQMIEVGHSSPYCFFKNVEVFGTGKG